MVHRGRTLPEASRANFARSIEGELCPKHRGRTLPEASRANFARSIEGELCPKHGGRTLPEASRVLFTSDEECSLRAMKSALYERYQGRLLPAVPRPPYGSGIKGVFYPQCRDRLLGAVSR